MNKPITDAERDGLDLLQRPLDMPNGQAAAVRTESASIMEVISRAASNPNVNIDVLDKLLAMYERLQSRDAQLAFNLAMTEAQAEMRPISADAENPQTKSKYASYAALDRALRPIYTKHGFALSFGEGDTPKPDHVRITCLVTRGGFERPYFRDMPADGKGAKGGDVMTKTHASGAAQSYGMRYLLKGIFNIAVGDDDNDGNLEQLSLDDPINEEKQLKIRNLIERARFPIEQVCEYMKVGAINQIKNRDYERCVMAINLRAKELDKKGSGRGS